MIYIGIVVLIFLLDAFIKGRVEKYGEEGREKKACKGALVIRKYHNRGAFLNAGENVSSFVAALSLILTLFTCAVFMLTLGQKGRGMRKTGLSLLLGGAFSNTYDRLRRRYVVDYFSFGVKWKPLRSVVFNISDFCILIGTVLAVCAAERERTI